MTSVTTDSVTGAAIGVLVRSTPLALGLGIAWLGPVERILQLSSGKTANWLPGLRSAPTLIADTGLLAAMQP